MNKGVAIFKGKEIRKTNRKKSNKVICRHDYKNAIKVGAVDYVCPLCRNLLDPMEWFFMNSFEFIEVESAVVAKKKGDVAGGRRKK